MKFNTVEEAVSDFKQGKFVIVVDDEYRENEGDFIIAAEKITPEAVNFMATHAKGLMCVGLTEKRAKELRLDPMVSDNTALHNTYFTVSVDYKKGTTTGISASDRAATIKALADPDTNPDDLGRPGHIFPIIARSGGVLRRTGHTEASVDLATIAGLKPVSVMCEIMDENGEMARGEVLYQIARKFGIKLITVEELIEYRRKHERYIERISEAELPTKVGKFKIIVYVDHLTEKEHVALVMGDISGSEPVMVRVHSECLTGDVFGSLRCDCGDQLDRAMRMIAEQGRGALLYLRQEGRGIGLKMGAQMLADLGIKKMKLLTNNPKKIIGLQGYGLEIVDRIPIEIQPNPLNEKYLKTKRDKMGHLILNNKK